jgi:hypothetical protein
MTRESSLFARLQLCPAVEQPAGHRALMIRE